MSSSHFYYFLSIVEMNILKNFFLICVLLSGCSYNHNKLYNTQPAFYSYIIGDVKSNKIYKQHSSKVYVTPASCQKTIIALVALKYLSPDFRFNTKLFLAKNKNSTIQDAVISFSGDPNLTSDELLQLLTPLKNKKIKGSIILDASIYNTPSYSEGLMLSDIGMWYSTPVSAINIDQNLFTVQIFPNKLDKLANVQNEMNFQVNSDIVTTNDSSKIYLFWNEGIIQAQGNVNITDTVIEKKLSPAKIETYIKIKIENILKQLNIKGDVKILYKKEQLPKNLVLANTIESEPLSKAIIPALKKSDNLFFDSLYLTIIHSHDSAKIKNWGDGSVVIKKLIKQYYDIDFENSVIIDGSGLSRYNQVQPLKLFELLKKGFLVTEFVNALANPGEEKSTLLKRKLPHTIKAKTGHVIGINCLCGYNIKPYLSEKDSSQAFVIIANSFVLPNSTMHNIIDDFIKNSIY